MLIHKILELLFRFLIVLIFKGNKSLLVQFHCGNPHFLDFLSAALKNYQQHDPENEAETPVLKKVE